MSRPRRPRAPRFAAALLLLLTAGCAADLRAPRNPDGSPMTLLVLVAPGITEGMPPAQADARTQGADALRTDLVTRLAGWGWAARAITSPEEAELGPSTFLAEVTLVACDRGNETARLAGRIAGGYGGHAAVQAAAAYVETSHEVLDEAGSTLASGTAWSRSTHGWTDSAYYCSSATARNITADMAARFAP